MGDRVLFQVIHGAQGYGPVVYCHWSGAQAPEIVRRLAARMVARPNDPEYATARLVQECVNGDKGALGFGVWNVIRRMDAEDSHGDAGVVLINCENGFRCTCLGGYLRTGADGFPELVKVSS